MTHIHHEKQDKSLAAAQKFARECLRPQVYVTALQGFPTEDGLRLFPAAIAVDGRHMILAFGPAFPRKPDDAA